MLIFDDLDAGDVVRKATENSTQKDIIMGDVQVSDPQHIGRHFFPPDQIITGMPEYTKNRYRPVEAQITTKEG